MIPYSLEFLDRFWSKVNKNGRLQPDGSRCWEWTASLDVDGYGRFQLNGKNCKSSRVAWELTNGPITEPQIHHEVCDNPPCCNPAHLKPGTQKQNMRTMLNRNRRNWDNAVSGELHHNTKLTEIDILKIRELYSTGRYVQCTLANMFYISPRTISDIVNRKTWAHI